MSILRREKNNGKEKRQIVVQNQAFVSFEKQKVKVSSAAREQFRESHLKETKGVTKTQRKSKYRTEQQ